MESMEEFRPIQAGLDRRKPSCDESLFRAPDRKYMILTYQVDALWSFVTADKCHGYKTARDSASTDRSDSEAAKYKRTSAPAGRSTGDVFPIAKIHGKIPPLLDGTSSDNHKPGQRGGDWRRARFGKDCKAEKRGRKEMRGICYGINV